ncbi:hypothetical protein BGX38DRAFT_1139708 [Terfezia claveryi]|nr:hypothetical protein BGX38DRAFT_1139708 [Terfezia claveryi]
MPGERKSSLPACVAAVTSALGPITGQRNHHHVGTQGTLQSRKSQPQDCQYLWLQEYDWNRHAVNLEGQPQPAGPSIPVARKTALTANDLIPGAKVWADLAARFGEKTVRKRRHGQGIITVVLDSRKAIARILYLQYEQPRSERDGTGNVGRWGGGLPGEGMGINGQVSALATPEGIRQAFKIQ